MLTTFEANGHAARGHAPSLVRALKRLGMRRCSESLVKRQWQPDPQRPSWYYLFVRWFTALWMVHRAGAEFLFEDFCARVAALRGTAAPSRDYFEQVALCAREHGEALAAAVERRDAATVRRELMESIAAERELLAMLDRPARPVRPPDGDLDGRTDDGDPRTAPALARLRHDPRGGELLLRR
jgi:hypothetical protein